MTKTSRTRHTLGIPGWDTFIQIIDEGDARRRIKLRREFRARWFIWRSALPISIISGISCEEILSGTTTAAREGGPGSQLFFTERSLAIWIAKTISDISSSQIGAVIDRKHSAVKSAFKRADDAISARDPKFFNLLTDVLYLENSELGSQKGHFIRPDRG